MSECFINNINVSGKKRSRAKFKSFIGCDNTITQKLNCVFDLNLKKISQLYKYKHKIVGHSRLDAKPNLDINAKGLKGFGQSSIESYLRVSGVINSRVDREFFFKNTYVDKFAGNINQISSINNFRSIQKLYPIKDTNNENFVDKNLQSSDLFNKIDEGVFLGNYNENLNIGFRVSDDNESYIQPFAKSIDGTFKYQCEVTPPYYHPKNNFLFIRFSSPISSDNAEIPPEYKLYNLILEDPSGNTIIKYKDLFIKGDASYTTYISEPEINNANLNTWNENYPILDAASGYKLNIDCDIICNAQSFTQGFDFGYEEGVCDSPSLSGNNNDYLAIDGAPLSTQSLNLNPSNTPKISAVEIATSGGLGIKNDNYTNLYVEFTHVGQKLSRSIKPNKLFTSDYDPQIYPSSNSLWVSSPDYEENSYLNTSEKHAQVLLNQLNNRTETQFITLINSNPAQDSGRLTLKFSHEPPQPNSELRGGSFNKSFFENNFDDSEYESVVPVDNYFVIDSLELKIKARKAVGSNDFSLDIVGYSDDKLLNITPKTGAFLQNTSFDQTGSVPSVSGFKNIDDLGISTKSLSDKASYYENALTSIDAGDHYILSSLPIIDSTEFEEYIIPLQIYEDRVDVGKSTDYSMSSYFENLYIDLFPIPSGASIESIELVVYYQPTNAVNLITFGRPNIKQLDKKDIKLLPQGWNKSGDVAINGNIEDAPLSIIENIPQAYKDHDTLRTNYSRRWRGVEGAIVYGPYNPNEFDFSFYNPQSDHPFLHGFYDLNNVSGDWIFSEDYAHSGYYNGSNQVLKNIGWRFNSEQLFNKTTDFKTLDWAEIGDPLYGKISDAFDSALSINSSDNIQLESMNFTNGCSIYLRFTPGENFDDSTVRTLFYAENVLRIYINSNNRFSVDYWLDGGGSLPSSMSDLSTYYEYQYPLSILFTFSAEDGSARLYCNNELTSSSLLVAYAPNYFGSNYLKDSNVIPFVSGDKQFYIHEFGISTSGNLVDSNPDSLLKQITAQSFFDSHSHSLSQSNRDKFKLHEYIDEDTSAWKLGAFKTCSFSVAFDGFTKRIGKDYLIHNLKHHGSGYESVTDLPLPSNVYASGLAYHTQIENDFLRFNLIDIPDANPNFYAIPPRISKTIPRGYKFDERAIVVDTILEHETEKYIHWKDGKVGPKLIVSLYSKNQDPAYRPSKVNWGLVNRSIHYLEPSGCYQKISSTFNHDDLLDLSEPWALFDSENSITEFSEKYYSKDIDDMFLQFDLVYPCSTFSIGTADGSGLISNTGGMFHSQQCGSPFEAKLKIHNVNVRLENALTYWQDYADNMNLYSSGQAIRFEQVDLFIDGHEEVFDSGFYLYTSGSPWSQDSGQLNITLASGILDFSYQDINLFVKQGGSFNAPQSFGSSDQIIYLPILMSGGLSRSDEFMSIVMSDNTLDQTFASNISLHTKAKSFTFTEESQSMGLFTDSFSIVDVRNSGAMNLFVDNNQVFVYSIENQFNLYVNTDANIVGMSGVCSLYTTNFGTAGTRGFFTWNNNNLGSAIDAIIDSGVPALEANDEIRGVDLICYGDCDDSDRKCEELPITLHDLTWYGDSICIEGGIFRPKGVYTNPNVIAFNDQIGYSGNFYGIRKFPDLLPNAPYTITIKTKTGTDSNIFLPAEYSELDYGSNDYVGYSGVKLAADKDSTPEERQPGNKFGKSIAVKKDIIAVGAPMQTLEYEEGDTTYTLDEAGAVFIYRRDPRPEGYSWPLEEHKSQWKLETKLTLPSGLFKDYYTTTTTDRINGEPIENPVTITQWEVGGEGRQLGHSLDLAINENVQSFGEDRREVLVVGGPSAKWSRTFDGLQPSGVNIALLVITDEFQPEIVVPRSRPPRILNYTDVLGAITNKDLLYTYFSDPPINFNVQVIVCEPRSSDNDFSPTQFPEPKPDFISNFVIPKNSGIITQEGNTSTTRIFNSLKSAFETVYPYDTSKIHNNIPIMMGVFLDNTMSLGESAVEPGLTQFLNYYREYSFASGLKDYNDVPVSGAVYKNVEVTENWISASIDILNDLLDTGRLKDSNEVNLFSEGVGPNFFNTNLEQFNVPPYSGGRVYVFEKESGNWNLIQEIKSPILSHQIDRYGHSVAISEDANIIGIGSPYIDECCQIWQYRPEAKQQVFDYARSWIDVKNSKTGGTLARYKELTELWDEAVEEYGIQLANEILYSNLTSTEKFEIRQFFEINEYEKIFNYTHGSIPYQGEAWSWIAEEFAPTSRLGYSVAINDDGNAVAFGAPTDSFNIFDDKNLYFTGNNTYGDWSRIGLDYTGNNDQTGSTAFPSWQNNVNAGAVRLFEARDYYPHSKVVEYGKFGNLQESLNDPLDEGHFNYLSGIFMDKDFRKMPEDEVEIPKDAGLAFIITPGVDAVSDEIVDNIISWLALGDRNLVLVGNDPEWEANGIYKNSNDIINKLLDRLNSRMRIYQARNKQEALVEPSSVVLPSFRPDGGVGSYIESVPLQTAYGVGDIRMHYPGFFERMTCYPDDPDALINLRAVNEKCELPLTHQGDLRAQFNDYCIWYPKGDPELVIYPVNWALRLGTSSVPSVCLDDNEPAPTGPLPSGDPVPLLAAALVKQVTFVQPATPPSFITVPITRTVNEPTEPVGFFITDQLQDEPAFIWNSGIRDYVTYSPNVFFMPNRSSPWFVPTMFEDRKGILQAKASTTSETVLSKEKVQDISIICAEESLANNSKIIAIASTELESEAALYSSFADRNIAFYRNMVAKNQRGESNIAQLGGWTGRASFVDAYSESHLNTIFTESNNNLKLNVDIDEEIAQGLNPYDVIWIANPKNAPNIEQVSKLKAWLDTGNKKLIVTHDNTITQMLIANDVLAALNSNIQTLFLPTKAEYYSESYTSFTINSAHPISDGFGLYPIDEFYFNGSFFSFKFDENVTPVAYVNEPVYDDKVLNNSFFRMNPGVDKISFPAVPGSGYRIFIDYVSENVSENQKITVSVANVSTQPNSPFPTLSTSAAPSLLETLEDDPEYNFNQLPADIGYSTDLQPATPNQIASTNFDVQVKQGQQTIDFYFSSIDGRILNPPFIPKTPRILSISGVMMPVDNRTGVTFYEEIIGYETIQVSEGSPRIEYTENVSGVIKSINDPYCDSEDNACIEEGYNNQLIANGPVVAAQELEMVTSFPAGVNRSRITVLSDSNLVQGRYMVDEFNTMSLETVQFIQSLYPNTVFPNPEIFGKQYTEITKIIAPERGSPQKYRALKNNIGSVVNFGSVGSTNSISSFNNIDSLYNPNFIERPHNEAWPENATPEEIEVFKSGIRDSFFANEISVYGGYTRYSGIVDGKTYVDAAINSGMPLLMKEKGYDYLDFDNFASGYPGDLFGYSIAIKDNKLVIGAPFAAFSDEEINEWNYYVQTAGQSGIELSYNGGAGAVYVYEKTKQGWEFSQKLRPDSINVGQDLIDYASSEPYSILGSNSYTDEFLINNSRVTDQFGYDVDIDSDIIVVGAPGHDFDKYTANTSGEYIRKEFDTSFFVPDRLVIELGNSGIREEIGSGVSVLNNGAVFTFENSIDDWTNRTQKWKFIEKVLPQGENARTQLLNENDCFGRSVSINRSRRTDSDYVIAVGSENHDYSSSGTHFVPSGGAAYTNDIMLRQPPPIAPDPNTYIDYKVFGSQLYDEYILSGITTNDEPNQEYTISGIVYTDRFGSLFLEASGQDPVSKGFIQHRPYVVSVEGVYFNGIERSENLPLYVGGKYDNIVENMNMVVAATTGNVYNILGMYTNSIVDFGSGILNLGINKDPVTISESGVFLYASGIGNNSDTLNMRIRGY